jgi:diacylglycerol O-acyltransferase / wax synthase
MTRLKALDAAFLYLETPENPMHIAGLSVLELPASYHGRFYNIYRDFLGARISFIDTLRRKLAPTAYRIDHPVWVEDAAFDLDYHVRGMILPAPGEFWQLEEMVARLHTELLDRSRPLWQAIVIEGLAGGRAALYFKVHHSEVDGMAALQLVQSMYELEPVVQTIHVAPRHVAKLPAPPQQTIGLERGLSDLIRHGVDSVHLGAELIRTAANVLLPAVEEGASLREIFSRDRWPKLPPIGAPRTAMNGKVGIDRSYAARSVPLPAVKQLAKAAGVKVNDIVLALSASALRHYLKDEDALPPKALNAFVPINAREAGATDSANHVTGMFCSLATTTRDPVARLREIAASAKEGKKFAADLQSFGGDFSFAFMPVVLPALVKLANMANLAEHVGPLCNVIISNLPGPPVPFYCAEARVTAMYPVSALIHGIGLNITVQSYIDRLDIGVLGDSGALPDIGRLADYMVAALDELAGALLPREPVEQAATHPKVTRLRRKQVA